MKKHFYSCIEWEKNMCKYEITPLCKLFRRMVCVHSKTLFFIFALLFDFQTYSLRVNISSASINFSNVFCYCLPQIPLNMHLEAKTANNLCIKAFVFNWIFFEITKLIIKRKNYMENMIKIIFLSTRIF